jgi:hypothetical protein
MSLKSSLKLSMVVCSSVIFGACGFGEIGSPAGPGSSVDSDGDGVPDRIDPNPTFANPDDTRVLADSPTGGNSNGNSNPGGTVSGKHEELSFSCNPDARASKSLERLSRAQYQNSLRDVLRSSASPATADAVITAVKPALDAFPTDATSKSAPFSGMDQSVSQAHADALVRIGTAVADALTSTAARIGELVGSCATPKSGTTMTTCIDTFIASFGKRVLRHDLNQAERDFYREVYASNSTAVDAKGLADIIAVMLNAPDFVYRVEYGKGQVGSSPSLFTLSDHEIATKLAFQFWQTTPDDELLAAADRGELSSDAGFEKALDRVLNHERAGEGLERFAREWLGLDGMRPLDSALGDPVFDAFAGEDSPTATLKEEMIQDVTDSLAFHALKDDGTFAEWLESPFSFAKSPDLAAIYHTPVWDGQAQPPRFPEGERAGLVTRAALLASGSANTRPIMKGVMIRERLLCDHLAAPPANATGELPATHGDKTTRELVTTITEAKGSACAGCHTTQINPLGFATEGYDALGRVRTKQDLYDAKGNVVASKPVDTTSVPRVWLTDTTASSGAADLTSMLIDSGKVEACFARQWVRYTADRVEQEATDGCELETLRSALESGESIKEALRRFAMLPQFRQRLMTPST